VHSFRSIDHQGWHRHLLIAMYSSHSLDVFALTNFVVLVMGALIGQVMALIFVLVGSNVDLCLSVEILEILMIHLQLSGQTVM